MSIELDDLPADFTPPLTPAEEYRHAAYSIALRGGEGRVDVSDACAALVARDVARFARLVRDYCRALATRPQNPPIRAPLAATSVIAALALTLLASGCGPGLAPPMEIADVCAKGDLVVELEPGAVDAQTTCDYVSRVLLGFREQYERRFGHVDLSTHPVRMRATQDLRTTGVDESFSVGGETYEDAIDLVRLGYIGMAHEMRHVQLGPGHGGWCDEYAPWSKTVLGWNQDAYLGCN